MITLTDANYFSPEAGREYLSVSSLKAFERCPSAWTAQYVTNEWTPPKTDALALGSLFHALVLEGREAADAVLVEYADQLLKKGGQPYAKAQESLDLAHDLRKTPAFSYLEGQHETIVTGEIAGARVKAKLDCLNLDGGAVTDGKPYISDLKKVASFEESWVPRLGKRGDFISSYQYAMQLAVYRELVRQQYGIQVDHLFLVCASPGTASCPSPDIRVFWWRTPDELTAELGEVRDLIAAIKLHTARGTYGVRCENCDWCRRSRTQFLFPVSRQIPDMKRAETPPGLRGRAVQ